MTQFSTERLVAGHHRHSDLWLEPGTSETLTVPGPLFIAGFVILA